METSEKNKGNARPKVRVGKKSKKSPLIANDKTCDVCSPRSPSGNERKRFALKSANGDRRRDRDDGHRVRDDRERISRRCIVKKVFTCGDGMWAARKRSMSTGGRETDRADDAYGCDAR